MREYIVFQAFDMELNLIKFISAYDVQWNRKYYEPGDFSISIPASQYDKRMKYIYTDKREETGKISERTYFHNRDGEKYVQISGNFLEIKLFQSVLKNELYIDGAYTGQPFMNYSGNVEDKIMELIEREYRYVSMLEDDVIKTIYGQSHHMGTETNFNVNVSEGKTLGYMVYYILKLHQLSPKVLLDIASKTQKISVWQGKDKTYYQNENKKILLSESLGTIRNIKVRENEENYKNKCYYLYAYERDDNFNFKYRTGLQEIPEDEGVWEDESIHYKDIRETFCDTSDINPESFGNFSAADILNYQKSVSQKAREKLKNECRADKVVNFEIVPGTYDYMSDIDLGDKCEARIEGFGIELTTRIIGIYESFSGGKHTISYEFGNKKIINR